eukprot:s148_g26.t1
MVRVHWMVLDGPRAWLFSAGRRNSDWKILRWGPSHQTRGPGHGLEIVCGSAAIVFILPGVLWTHASTTTACNRLPSLVTLCEVEDEEEDAEYMDLAMYLLDLHRASVKASAHGRSSTLMGIMPSFSSAEVSGQLQVENFCCGLGDVYTFGPTFRAENSSTTRHLAEFWMIEPEMAFANLEDDMDCAEAYIRYCVSQVLEKCQSDVDFFNLRVDKEIKERLELIASKDFARMSYTEAVEVLQKHIEQGDVKFEFEVAWGKELQTEHEKFLTDHVCKGPLIVYNYPKECKAFYMRLNEDGKTVAAMDLLCPGIGELVGGSQREERIEVLDERIEGCVYGIPGILLHNLHQAHENRNSRAVFRPRFIPGRGEALMLRPATDGPFEVLGDVMLSLLTLAVVCDAAVVPMSQLPSCHGRCGVLSPGQSCQCISWCHTFKNCCKDYYLCDKDSDVKQPAAESPPTQPPTTLAPATLPPTTPTTLPPTTLPPTTLPPTTRPPPTTLPPTTLPPTTMPPPPSTLRPRAPPAVASRATTRMPIVTTLPPTTTPTTITTTSRTTVTTLTTTSKTTVTSTSLTTITTTSKTTVTTTSKTTVTTTSRTTVTTVTTTSKTTVTTVTTTSLTTVTTVTWTTVTSTTFITTVVTKGAAMPIQIGNYLVPAHTHCPGFGPKEITIHVRGMERRFFLFLPKGRTDAPLWLAFHGSQNMAMDFLHYSCLHIFTIENGIGLLALQGLPNKYDQGWTQFNVGPHSQPTAEENEQGVHDLEVMREILEQVLQLPCVDKRRVHCTGYSNGGRFCMRLASEMSDIIASVAPVSGLRYPQPNNARRPIPLLAFHGEMDPVNPWGGHGKDYWEASVPDAFMKWAQFNQCGGASMAPAFVNLGGEFTMASYKGCKEDASVELIRLNGAGHQWPNALYAHPGLGNVARVDANVLIRDFFSKHRLPEEDLAKSSFVSSTDA